MIVYFLRHASAGERRVNAEKDAARPLDPEGILQCGLMGRVLAALEVQVDSVISSPLKRASQTAVLVSNEIGYEGKLFFDDSLRPAGSFAEFRAMLDKRNRDEAILVVGHNPNLSEFLGHSIARHGEAHIELKKAGVAKVDLGKRGGSLEWCLSPRVIRAAQETAPTSSRPKSSRK
jgi:phosphohistidine phosphatase